MIDFSLTDEQKALRELAHDFAAREIRPVAWEYDRESTWPQAIIEKAWEVGLMNPQIPAEYGGAGFSRGSLFSTLIILVDNINQTTPVHTCHPSFLRREVFVFTASLVFT